ncbi:MAG: class IV adenylate cyclase [Gemmatimonadaceae bacterium]
MLEVELKSVVDDVPLRRAAIESAGAVLTFEGRLADRRYDMLDGSLVARDHVLRVRGYGSQAGARAELGWKGPTGREGGYKVREELEVSVDDSTAIAAILERLGFRVTVATDREIAQYDLHGAMVRFETYPRMDQLVEVEGSPDRIERAIAALGLPRVGFTAEPLTEFVRRFQARTGLPAALSDAELHDISAPTVHGA